MSSSKLLKTGMLAAAMSVAVTQFVATDANAASKGKEKCFGVSKAGKNDCGAAGLSCAGAATKDDQGNAFLVVPKGLCEKLAGGSTSPITTK